MPWHYRMFSRLHKLRPTALREIQTTQGVFEISSFSNDAARCLNNSTNGGLRVEAIVFRDEFLCDIKFAFAHRAAITDTAGRATAIE